MAAGDADSALGLNPDAAAVQALGVTATAELACLAEPVSDEYVPLLAGAAAAQAQTLYVAGYGGSFEQTIRKEIFPAFTKKFGGTVEYIAGNSTDTVAKLQAQRGNQQIDVAIVDDGPMYQAIALGFCAPIVGLPDADIVKAARYKDDKAVGMGLVAGVHDRAFQCRLETHLLFEELRPL